MTEKLLFIEKRQITSRRCELINNEKNNNKQANLILNILMYKPVL